MRLLYQFRHWLQSKLSPRRIPLALKLYLDYPLVDYLVKSKYGGVGYVYGVYDGTQGTEEFEGIAIVWMREGFITYHNEDPSLWNVYVCGEASEWDVEQIERSIPQDQQWYPLGFDLADVEAVLVYPDVDWIKEGF